LKTILFIHKSHTFVYCGIL